jgi:LysM repeat protein
MNDRFTNNVNGDDENIARKLSQVAEKTNVNPQFAAELEERLRTASRPKSSWSVSMFGQISPALRWVALMILLALVLSWSIKNLVPPPQPAVNDTPAIPIPGTETTTPEPLNLTATPVTQEGGYDFRGAKLYLQQPLPESPDQANIYLLKKDEAATEAQALALADRFGIQGEMYTAPDYIFNTTDYVISDGKQLLQVYSNRYFTYTANLAGSRTNPYGVKPSDHAEATIQQFLKARGFDFPFSISTSSFSGEYSVKPLAPDSIPMQYESFTPPVMRVALDEHGEVLGIDASLIDYDSSPVGEYGIISAQEALQILLNDNILAGKMEYFHSANRMPKEWYRSYPDNQPVTAYGYISAYSAVDPSQPALILMNGVSLTGNINGLENLDDYTFVKATGQYRVENGIRKFNVDSWDRKVQETSVEGILSRQADQIVITSDNGTGQEYPLIDPPADVPLETKVPDTQLTVSGVIVDGKLDWTYIQYFDNYSSGGGGGSNGIGFYQLNLSGTPVPFPSPTPQPVVISGSAYIVQENDTLASIADRFGITLDQLAQANNLSNASIINADQVLIIPDIPSNQRAAGQKIQGVRGLLNVSIHNKSDGSQRVEYTLLYTPKGQKYLYALMLEGTDLQALQSYQNRPIEIWGTVDHYDQQYGIPVGKVERFEIPFPDLQFQILRGKQKKITVAGQSLTLFTTDDGANYVQTMPGGDVNIPLVENAGGEVIVEALAVPDETISGYPALQVFSSGSATNPKNGQPLEPQITADQPYIVDETTSPASTETYTHPNLTIDTVELIYFVSNPYYQVNDPNYSQRTTYIQPVWHFHGRYEDGGEFDVLIQALKQESLLPELAPWLSPG